MENVEILLYGPLIFHSFGGNTMTSKTISFTAHRSQLPGKERASRLGCCNNLSKDPTMRNTDFLFRGGEASGCTCQQTSIISEVFFAAVQGCRISQDNLQEFQWFLSPVFINVEMYL